MGDQAGRMTAHPPVSAVLVDPFENPELRELAELAGLPLRWCAAWLLGWRRSGIKLAGLMP